MEKRDCTSLEEKRGHHGSENGPDMPPPPAIPSGAVFQPPTDAGTQEAGESSEQTD